MVAQSAVVAEAGVSIYTTSKDNLFCSKTCSNPYLRHCDRLPFMNHSDKGITTRPRLRLAFTSSKYSPFDVRRERRVSRKGQTHNRSSDGVPEAKLGSICCVIIAEVSSTCSGDPSSGCDEGCSFDFATLHLRCPGTKLNGSLLLCGNREQSRLKRHQS